MLWSQVWDQIDFVTQAVILMMTPAARGWLAPGNPLRLGFCSCIGRGEGAQTWDVAKVRRKGLEHGEECVPRGEKVPNKHCLCEKRHQ